MSAIALRSEERLGLGVAIAAHLALIAVLIVLAARKPPVIQLPERVVVSLAEDVSPKSTAPKPAPEAQAAIAETLTAKPKPKPKPKEKAPEVKKAEKPKKPPPMQRSTGREEPKPQSKKQKSGGSLIGKNFLKGAGASTASEAKAAAAQVGPEVKAALAQAVARQLKPHWQQPDGVDVDKLATTVEWELNPDGSLAGPPRVIGTTGVDDFNRLQVGRHQEMAVRAVRLAAPFNLPEDYYSAWKRIKFTFDWKLN